VRWLYIVRATKAGSIVKEIKLLLLLLCRRCSPLIGVRDSGLGARGGRWGSGRRRRPGWWSRLAPRLGFWGCRDPGVSRAASLRREGGRNRQALGGGVWTDGDDARQSAAGQGGGRRRPGQVLDRGVVPSRGGGGSGSEGGRPRRRR